MCESLKCKNSTKTRKPAENKEQYIYRLWFPMVGYHGSDFNKLCGKCQEKIEAILKEGFLIPCTISLDTSMEDIEGYNIEFSFQRERLILCEDCGKELKAFLDSAKFLRFGLNKSIELWRNKKDESV